MTVDRLASRAAWLLPLPALALLLPMLLAHGHYMVDWSSHFTLLAQQATAQRALRHPTYFSSTDVAGIFEPFYAFYGGSLYAIGGVVVNLTGSTLVGFVLLYAAAGAMAYGGTWWIGRQLGLTRPVAHLPALAVVTPAYYVSNAYGLGHWPEFVAVSTLPLLIAAGTAVVRAPRVRGAHAVLLWIATLLLTGSHNVTLVWGTTFLIVLGVALALAVGPRRVRVPRDRLAWLVIVPGLAVAANLWFLLPNLAYSRQTTIYQTLQAGGFDPYFNRTMGDIGPLLNPGRRIYGGHIGVYVACGVYGLAWALAALAAGVRRRRGDTLMRMSVAVLGVLGIFTFLFLAFWFWAYVPLPFTAIQSPERTVSYVDLAVTAAVIAGLLAIRGRARSRWWIAALVVALGAQTGWSLKQAFTATQSGTLSALADPATPRDAVRTIGATDYRLTTGRPADATQAVAIDPHTAFDGQVELSGPPTADRFVRTNIVFSPFLHVRGGYVRGRTPEGFAVLGITDPTTPWGLTVTTRHTTIQRLGLAGTWLALLLSLLGLVWLVARGRRRPGRPPAPVRTRPAVRVSSAR